MYIINFHIFCLLHLFLVSLQCIVRNSAVWTEAVVIFIFSAVRLICAGCSTIELYTVRL